MAKYTMQEVNDLNHEGKTLLYPRMVIEENVGTEQLVRAAAKSTSFSAGELKGMLEAIRGEMAWQMAQGRSVRLEGIGTFTPALALRKGKEREEADGKTRRNALSIRVGSVHFRADKELARSIDLACQLERVPGGYKKHVSKYAPEERLRMAQEYLETHAELTVAAYAELTGLSRTTASRELRRWHETEGSGIGIKGLGSHRVYVSSKKE